MKKLSLIFVILAIFVLSSCTVPNNRVITTLLSKEKYDFLPAQGVPEEIRKHPYKGIVSTMPDFPGSYKYAILGQVIVPDSSPLTVEEKLYNFKLIAGAYGANALVFKEFDPYIVRGGIKFLRAHAIFVYY